MRPARIGIFGGSFNPVHIGHLIVADYMAQYAGFDQVWLTLSPLNPLKASVADNLIPDRARLDMLRIAVGECQRLKVCDIELTLPRPSFTYVTLDALQALYPDHSFSLIIGSDNWDLFGQWRRADYILSQYGVTVYPRGGYDRLPARKGMTIVYAPKVEISSTFIREAIAAGHDMTYFLPAGVMEYINLHNYYKTL